MSDIELHEEFLRLRRIEIQARWNLRDFIENCKHKIIQSGDSAVCNICEKRFGWWCPSSPNHLCEIKGEHDGYYDESCKYCGQPDERD